MIQAKRYNPLLMLFQLFNLIKNSIFFVVFLFVIKAGSDSAFIKYGKVIFILAFVITFISIIIKWFTTKYAFDNKSFYLYKGIFSKSERSIPFSKIQNINRHTALFHRIFRVTSISFETGIKGENASVKFEVVSRIEADRMEAHLSSTVHVDLPSIQESDANMETFPHEEDDSKVNSIRVLHFKLTKKDTLKASFTSFSFLLLIPLIASLYFKINDIFHVEEEAEGVISEILNSWWLVFGIIIFLVIASAAFGIVSTYLKYGKYEISSDFDRIYITKGVINETSFSISKEKVQAIEIKQSTLKRVFGLAEVKLTSAGGLGSEEDKHEINSLYPYLPIRRAYEIVSDILPTYEVTEKMDRLPKKSLWVRLLWPSWIWIITTAVLYYFKPAILNVEKAWWIISACLFVIIGVTRLLDFYNTRYVLNDRFVQFKKGSLTTTLFVSKREKVIEVRVSRNIIQKLLGLASIKTINRAKPVYHAGIEDVPQELANVFYKWYKGRKNEIKLE
ncbi:PH domain-containing protein [Cytobacillus solani]|uniref:PH domain-containing protein n=1 Tax=Cytobacillus solani TaxID=1637975 RepID=UPI0020797E7D|nr:PH domain-containing protein [Cytobacillus solani]USK55400.1 PH domain-containing protein [Cytobacillus solani]